MIMATEYQGGGFGTDNNFRRECGMSLGVDGGAEEQEMWGTGPGLKKIKIQKTLGNRSLSSSEINTEIKLHQELALKPILLITRCAFHS